MQSSLVSKIVFSPLLFHADADVRGTLKIPLKSKKMGTNYLQLVLGEGSCGAKIQIQTFMQELVMYVARWWDH